MTTQKYKLYNYDVWGNEEDGYNVNDVYPTGDILTFKKDPTDKQILDKLRKLGFFAPYARTADFNVEGEDGYTLYIDYKDCPFCELRAI